MVNILGVEASRKLKAILLSKDIVSSQINEVVTDLCNQIIQKVKSSESFAIQFYETMGVEHFSVARCESNGSITENMLFCNYAVISIF